MSIVVVAEKDTIGLGFASALQLSVVVKDRWAISGNLPSGAKIHICWCNGHVMELAEPQEYSPEWGSPWRESVLPIRPPGDEFIYRPKRTDLVHLIGRFLTDATEVVNACDAGREGELIFRELFFYLPPLRPKVKLTRMWIASTTDSGLCAAWASRENGNSRSLLGLAEAGVTRQQADWLWGTNFTRKVTKLLERVLPEKAARKVWHVGRVQTPVLRMLYDRSDKISKFTPQPFYRLHAEFVGSGGAFRAKVVAPKELRHGHVDTHFRDFAGVSKMMQVLQVRRQTPWMVQDQKEPKESLPPAPFSLDDLQQSANMMRNLRFTAKETLDLAQRLYHDEKAITYPRTDSSYLPEDMRAHTQKIWESIHSEWVVHAFPRLAPRKGLILPDRWFNDDKVSDHHAIIPTGVIPEPFDQGGAIRPEFLLWQLIAMRFIQAWLPAAEVTAASRILLTPLEENPNEFHRAFLECAPVSNPGWMQDEEWTFNTRGHGVPLARQRQQVIYPDCIPAEAKLTNLWIDSGNTTAPEWHDDAMLLREMKEAGLGTPATRAQCIEDLVGRTYLLRTDAKRLRISSWGDSLISMLELAKAQKLYDPALTAAWEAQLDKMTKAGRERPTRPAFLNNLMEEAGRIIAELDGLKLGPEVVFCPDSGKRVESSEDGARWVFHRKFKEATCYKNVRGRDMSAADYRDIFTAGKKGGGPFTFKSKSTGADYECFIVFHPSRKGREQWEFKFKRRGRRTRALDAIGAQNARPAA